MLIGVFRSYSQRPAFGALRVKLQ